MTISARSAWLLAAAMAGSCLAASCSSSTPRSQTSAPPANTADQSQSQRPTPRVGCRNLPSTSDLKEYLRRAPGEGGEAGGLFSGRLEWAAVVNRSGEICATATSTDDPSSVWPGGQAIAKAKAYTANAFSTDLQPLSTARLYTMTQPGHSMSGVGGPNAFNPECLESPQTADRTDGKICGGSITFGGGVPLYRGGVRIGGLGVSGDTPCADHEIAKRIRHLAQLDPEKGATADDISYASAHGGSVFTHPLCPNTWLNGKRIGDEGKD